LARGGGDFGDGGGDEGEDDDGGEDAGAGEGAGGVVEELDEGVAGWGVEDGGDVAESEAEGDGHDEAEQAVEAEGRDHGARERGGGVFDFFGHVHGAVEADEGEDWGEKADHEGGAVAVPGSAVGELGEDSVCWGDGCEDPEDWIVLDLEFEVGMLQSDGPTNDDREKANDVENEQQAFDQRKLFSQSSVEEDSKSGDSDNQKSSMPWSLTVQRILFVVECNQSLNDRSAEESDRANRSLPTSETKPANNVRQEALEPWWRPF
jgi:hypothetical protein